MKTYMEYNMKRLITITALVLCLSATALAGNMENPSKNGNLENPSRSFTSDVYGRVLYIVKLHVALMGV